MLNMKLITKRLLKFFLFFIGSIAVYFLCAFTFSTISIEKENITEEEITGYILSNGVHTDIVVPTTTSQYDWKSLLNHKHTISNDSTLKFTSFGWGDKGFYLETPTWDDLKFSAAFKAAFGLSHSALHVTYYNDMKESETCKSFKLNKTQYIRLIKYIKKSFVLNKNSEVLNIETKLLYGNNDAFYEANGSYSLFKTCNTWTNSALKICGQKACLWTPFASGIFYQYK